MAMMFGRFEIQSELSKSDTALIYKALDTESNQVVALKTQSLEALGERAERFVETLIAEGESTRSLACQNIVLLYGAGEIDGQFCAAMEYIQGNSVATMLARKEGFSIWDLIDITRQVCAAVEHAAGQGAAHSSLEPAKIMVQWDGMVKILGYGISNMSLIEAEMGKGLGRLMPYCSPEQIRGEAIDLRSNLFTVGAILYEMVAGRKAFDAGDAVALVNQIENEMPASPGAVNAKVHPAVGALIMKALAKDPAERYQTARELLDDLELCKENGKKAGAEVKKTTTAAKVVVDAATRAAAASKFVSAGNAAPAQSAARTVAPKAAAPRPAPVMTTAAPVAVAPPAAPVPPKVDTAVFAPANPFEREAMAAAAAAGAGTGGKSGTSSEPGLDSGFDLDCGSPNSESPAGAGVRSDFAVSASDSYSAESAVMSAAVVEPEAEEQARRINVDPMMAGPVKGSAGKSFSDLAEMPPLKERVFTPRAPEVTEPMPAALQVKPREEENPRIQPREVAEKAMKQIATIPPRLMLFSILGAVGLILVIAIAVFFHVRTEDDGTTSAPQPAKHAKANAAQPVAQAPAETRSENAAAPVAGIAETQPRLTVRQVERRNANSGRRAPAPAPVAAPMSQGLALIDSTPQGAQFQVDGRSDPSWVTPFTVTGLSVGKHIISVSKAGYSSEIRSVEVAAGSTASLQTHLTAMNALVVLNSTPAGAAITIDGKPTARVTPAQFAVEKGSHTVLLRKQGYLDETVTADLEPAQNFQYAPVLKALGNTEDMRTVGKLNKLFGRVNESTAGMGSISIHTQPKGAQVAINQRVLEKMSPLDVMVGPGNYIVDVTLTGFKPVHKVVSVEKGSKAAIDEVLERQ